jgi:hypothetical protein
VARILFFALLSAVLGALVATGISRAVAQRHQQTHAVMWLMGAHLWQLELDVRAHACQNSAADLDTLRFLQREMPRVFADSLQQDSQFRARSEALVTALQNDPRAALGCGEVSRQVKALNQACEACHREFR